MDDPGKDPSEEVSVEHDPTLAFEPRAGEKERGASGSRVEGAFAWALVVETGPQAGLSYVLGPGETVAGRGPDSDIFLGDVTVSREHARFFVDDHGLTVEDMGSTNGTYVNGDRVDAYALNPDDELIIGKFHLVVAQGSA